MYIIDYLNFNFISDTFGQFDFGGELNLKHYGNITPPQYNLKSIKVPVVLIYADNDLISNPTVGDFRECIKRNIIHSCFASCAGCDDT